MRLLLAEDDVGLRGVLERGLKEEGYIVDAVLTGNEALDHLRAYDYDICVLDWRMPGASGLDILTWARARGLNTPFLMLTAKDGVGDRLRALGEGADDYLVKPFDYENLLARLRVLLQKPGEDRALPLRCGSLTIDPVSQQAFVGGEPAHLTPREFAIIELLARKSPAVVSRRSIVLLAWPEEAGVVDADTIEVHIACLRAKLACADTRIETFRSAGYRLIAVSK